MGAPAIETELTAFMRPAQIVMDLDRLGAGHAHPLSFMRILIRRMISQNWKLSRRKFELDADGYGDVIYEIKTPHNLLSLVVFSQYLDPNIRSDRVIAEAWDVTMVLRIGEVDGETLERLRANVPLQEKGRVDSDCIVLSRANRSERNFNYVLDCLCRGEQPDAAPLAKVGYLYRTTAVYGSGKFGMADWEKVRTLCPELSTPFSAEMLVCFLIRQFSLDRLHHMARARTENAAELDPSLQKYMGIGNATGLGMAPYLINHPLLIARWVEVRETALARILSQPSIDPARWETFVAYVARACRHLSEIDTDNIEQNELNRVCREDLDGFLSRRISTNCEAPTWDAFFAAVREDLSVSAQEVLQSCLLETYVDLISDIEDQMSLEERYELDPSMKVSALQDVIETGYRWALEIDFDSQIETAKFWYKSEEKMEPRLGDRYEEPGADKEMFLGIAREVQAAHKDLNAFAADSPEAPAADFLMEHPEHRAIVRRIQTMSATHYGEIQANLLHEDVLPIHLLRCKLSFFGVSKFDPRSRLWVRNTMFQGAPMMDEIGPDCEDDSAFPVCAAYDRAA